MEKGYISKDRKISKDLETPRTNSCVSEEDRQNKSFGTIIDEIFSNPKNIMIQAGKIIEELKKEAERQEKQKRNLEDKIIEKDKEIAYLKGKVDTMRDFIKEMKEETYVELAEIKEIN